jgi:hypothetical protein
LDYFVEQPGRYTFVEAFFANQHSLIDRLETNFPGNARLINSWCHPQSAETPVLTAVLTANA